MMSFLTSGYSRKSTQSVSFFVCLNQCVSVLFVGVGTLSFYDDLNKAKRHLFHELFRGRELVLGELSLAGPVDAVSQVGLQNILHFVHLFDAAVVLDEEN